MRGREGERGKGKLISWATDVREKGEGLHLYIEKGRGEHESIDITCTK